MTSRLGLLHGLWFFLASSAAWAQTTYSLMLATSTLNGTASYSSAGTQNPRNDLSQMAIGAKGHIYLIGTTGQHGGATQTDMLIARFSASGPLDTGFNGNGRRIITDLVPNAPYVSPSAAVALTAGATTEFGTYLSDDYLALISSVKIGTEFRKVLSMHRQSDGTLVPSFGTNGAVTLPKNEFDYFVPSRLFVTAQATSQGTEHKFVVAGRFNSSQHPMGAIRLTARGALDTTYGQNGVARFPYSVSQGGITPSFMFVDADIDDDGRVVLLGAKHDTSYNASPAKYDALVARLTHTGTVDTSFGTNGHTIVPLLQIASGADVGALMVDDRRAVRRFPGQISLATTSIGSATVSTASSASATPAPAGSTIYGRRGGTVTAAALIGAGTYRIYVGGGQRDGTNFGDPKKAVVLRLTEAGALDSTFASSGRFKHQSRILTTYATVVRSISRAKDDKIVLGLGGQLDTDPRPNYNPSKPRGSVVRITSAGALDTTLGPLGEANVAYVTGSPPNYHPNTELSLRDMVVGADGRIYLGFDRRQ